jgi:hypothetical protein
VQLTRKADNVWLLTATPFPHGNQSVSANHQLLGFQRFNVGNVEVAGRSLHSSTSQLNLGRFGHTSRCPPV